jgi:hypothetical protein
MAPAAGLAGVALGFFGNWVRDAATVRREVKAAQRALATEALSELRGIRDEFWKEIQAGKVADVHDVPDEAVTKLEDLFAQLDDAATREALTNAVQAVDGAQRIWFEGFGGIGTSARNYQWLVLDRCRNVTRAIARGEKPKGEDVDWLAARGKEHEGAIEQVFNSEP